MIKALLFDNTFKQWTQLVITQNNYLHKTLLGKEKWGEVESIKHCEKRFPLMT